MRQFICAAQITSRAARSALILCLSMAMTFPAAITGQAQNRTPLPEPAQTPPLPDQSDEVVKIATNVVQVDAVVTDKQGRQVTNLQASDFEIAEGGQIHQAEFSSYIPLTEERAKTSSGVPGDELEASELRRTIAFVVANPLIKIRAILGGFATGREDPGSSTPNIDIGRK